MGGPSISRNAPCPCGTGRKYKRCCLADEERAVREARFDDAVGRRIQDWSADEFDDEIGAALEEFVGPERTMDDDDIQIFATWFHQDHELAGGGTPAERYAARSELPTPEREAALRIAVARLGLYRVLAVEPGRSLTLEHLLDGTCIGVRSPHVSRDAVRWDILLARVLDGDPPSLWGPTRFFEPCEEPELRAELARLAGSPVDELDEQALAATFRRHALELMRFLPPSRSAEPSFFTLEGDQVAFTSAIWEVHDVAAAVARMRELGALRPDDPVELDITAERDALVRRRPLLPPGALVLESSTVDALDTIPIATLRLEGDELHVEAMSEPRLAQALEIVAADFGDLVELRSQDVTAVDQALAARSKRRRGSRRSTPPPVDAEERRLIGDLATERMRRWLDEPHPLLDGRTPREAVVGANRAEVVRLLRQIENGAERARRRGEPAADVTPLRDELGLRDELAA
jgi:hypothetical protein